jgi:hypothetical protein
MPVPDLPAPAIADLDEIVLDNNEVGFPHVIANLTIVKVAALSVHSNMMKKRNLNRGENTGG